jgi:hypothetical protein
MANGNGQGIGGIGRVRRSIEAEKACDHVLDLFFVGATIADDSGLDGQRRVFGNDEASTGGGEHGNTAHVTKLEGGLHVHSKEDVFNGNFLWMLASNDFLQALENFIETLGDGGASGGVDGSNGNAMQLTGSVEFNDAVASVFRAAIYAEDSH